MRLAAYAGTSVALAVGVVVHAFNQRTNFYSACVYLAQSNLCLMILTNLILLCVTAFVFGLQRILYGRLRPIEIEQLYEKAWFAITETCLAMTIFREEVGAWFLVMFVGLLAGKVWGWIGEGRVEVLEQQPPTNPRLFHIRLSLSLFLSLAYDLWLMYYTANTVIQQARPNMMVMFLFELAVLTTSTISTALRYIISLVDAKIVKQQTTDRLVARRSEVRAERERILAERAAAVPAAEGEAPAQEETPIPSEDDVDEMDIEVPGWEAKGQWVLSLDLATDFVKLCILSAFFCILLTFYGLPIHIMRDLFLTARSFIKRLTAFVKYRRATRDMNSRYPDATVEEIQREDTCIICREEMRPWSITNPAQPQEQAAEGAAAAPSGIVVNERSRPKKLPCGHVLHLGCLKSWLERQQVCPTCRSPVVEVDGNSQQRPHAGGQVPGQGPPLHAAGAGNGVGAPQAPPRNPNIRNFGWGPLRVAFGRANMQDMVNNQIANAPPGAQGAARMYGLELGFPRRQAQARPHAAPNTEGLSIQEQLQQVEQRIVREIQSLQISQQELGIVSVLQQELIRLRQRAAMTAANGNGGVGPTQQPLPNFVPNPFIPPIGIPGLQGVPGLAQQLPVQTNPASFAGTNRVSTPILQRFGAPAATSAIPSGSSELPPGVVIPEGWSLLPLSRLEGASSTDVNAAPAASSSASPAAPPIINGMLRSTRPGHYPLNYPFPHQPAGNGAQIHAPTPTRPIGDLLSPREAPTPPSFPNIPEPQNSDVPASVHQQEADAPSNTGILPPAPQLAPFSWPSQPESVARAPPAVIAVNETGASSTQSDAISDLPTPSQSMRDPTAPPPHPAVDPAQEATPGGEFDTQVDESSAQSAGFGEQRALISHADEATSSKGKGRAATVEETEDPDA